MPDDADPDFHAGTEAFGTADRTANAQGPRPAPPAVSQREHHSVLKRGDRSPWEPGRGAMGVADKAFDTRRHWAVALKVIHAELLQKRPVLRDARIAVRPWRAANRCRPKTGIRASDA